MVEENEKEDEETKVEKMHQRKVKPPAWRGGTQILEKEEKDARLMDRCEAKRKEWAKHWQCGESVQNMEDEPQKHEELKKLEEALPRLRFVKGKNRSRLRWLPPKSFPGFHKRNKRRGD